jgi:hypothetical protein
MKAEAAPFRRIIPCLDIAGGRVVKGVRFLNLRDAGDPVELAGVYQAEGADELAFLDITASPDLTQDGGRHGRASGPPDIHPADGGRRHSQHR